MVEIIIIIVAIWVPYSGDGELFFRGCPKGGSELFVGGELIEVILYSTNADLMRLL